MKSQEIFHILILLFSVHETNAQTITDLESERCNICTWDEFEDQWNVFQYDCSYCGLKEIPRFTTDVRKIHLSYNNISMIRNTSFLGMPNLREIYLDNNILTVIENNSFAHLTEHLLLLVLAHNNLITPSLVSFRFLKNLQHLDISWNNYNNYSDSIKNLTNLEILKVDILEKCSFGEQFENLRKLKVFQFVNRNPSVKLSLDYKTFEGLRNSKISNLSLVLPRQVKGLGINILKPFRYVKNLVINIGGDYDIKDVLRILYGLRNRSLDYMDLSNNRRNIYRYHHLTINDVKHLLSICVKSIDLSGNFIYHFPFWESLNTSFSNCLQKFVYKGNIQYWATTELFGITFFPHLRYIDFSISPLCKTYAISKHFEWKFPFRMNFTSNALHNLEYLDLSSIDLSEIISHDFNVPHQPSNLTFYFNLTNLRIVKAANTYLDLCGRDVYFSRSLVTLDMSGWNCQSFNPSFLLRHKDLVYLNASNSKIGDQFNGFKLKVFSSLTKLQNIDLSHNNIYRFRTDLLHDQSYSLHHLNISFNRIKNIPEMLMHLKYLRTVELQNNEFISFDDTDRYIINTLGNTTFDLKGNILECTCQNIDSLLWLNRTKNIKNNLFCKDGTMVSMFFQDINYFRLRCLSEFWLDFSVIVLLFVMITLLVVTIGYRNKSFFIYLYMKLRRHIKQRESEIRRNDYKYDVFVSYSHMDYNWVTRQLFHYLSNELSLEVCLHQKDFIPGEPIASEILRCVESSRKTVFVITRNFLASKWSIMEMEIARHHVFNDDNDTIIVILKEDIPLHEMPLSLRKIWWRIVCLKYPQTDNRFEHEVFDKKLSDAFSLKT